jgi:hypothetical protein
LAENRYGMELNYIISAALTLAKGLSGIIIVSTIRNNYSNLMNVDVIEPTIVYPL